MLLVMNLQQSLAAGPRIRLELTAPVLAFYLSVRRSFLARFPVVGGQVEHESIQPGMRTRRTAWLRRVKRAHGPLVGAGNRAWPGIQLPKNRVRDVPD